MTDKQLHYFSAMHAVLGAVLLALPLLSSAATLQNPLAVSSFCGLFVAIYKGILAIGVSIAVLFIVIAGLRFVVAQGNSEKLTEARKNFVNTIIGLAIFLGAMLLVNVVASTINSIQTGAGGTSLAIPACR